MVEIHSILMVEIQSIYNKLYIIYLKFNADHL